MCDKSKTYFSPIDEPLGAKEKKSKKARIFKITGKPKPGWKKVKETVKPINGESYERVILKKVAHS